MRPSLRAGLVVLALQSSLLATYWLVERGRAAPMGPHVLLGADPGVEVQGVLPPLTARRPGEPPIELRSLSRPTLVHFWATWCPPCRAELPRLLQVADEGSVDVLAVALDPAWAEVERFFDGPPPASVLLGDGGRVERALEVRSLPVTLFVEPGGRLVRRFDGARDWDDARLRELLRRLD